MTRRRSRTPGASRPASRRSLSIHGLLLTATLAVLVAACAGAADGSPTPEPTDTSAASPITSGPAATDAPVTEAPTATPTEAPTATAVPTPTAEPSPTGGGTGGADACTGTDENREFFTSVAGAVDWPVYCPVLGSGWSVDAGQYRLAGGGRMEIGYRGPSGARIELKQGYFCDTMDCSGGGTELGDAAFGDLRGVMLDQDGGRFGIVAVAIDGPVWLLTTDGLDEDEARSVGANLVRIGA